MIFTVNNSRGEGKGKGKAVPVHAMKACRRVEV
jgi:hypothetical protein